MDLTFQEILVYQLIKYNNFEVTPLALGIIMLAFFGVKLLLILFRKFLRRFFKAKNFEEARADAAVIVAKYFLWTIYIIACIRAVGLDITWLVAGGAALLVGIGMGIQNVFNDFVSGIILLFEGTVDPGDIITVEGYVARVKQIGIRSSQIVTRNNITILVPNHKLTEDNVINWSHMNEPPRFHVSVGVAYGSDTEKVCKLLLEAATEHPKVLDSPQPFTRFVDFGSSSLNFELYFRSNEVFWIEDVLSELRMKIDKKFRENEVVIPFPQTDLHIKSSNIGNLNKA